MSQPPESPEASLFVTCVVDQFYPEIGESTVRILRRLGVDVDFPSTQTCCGQPAFNSGFWSVQKRTSFDTSNAIPIAFRNVIGFTQPNGELIEGRNYEAGPF